VVDNDRICAELYDEMEQPLAANAVRESVRRLRRALAGSRYEIVNHPTLGYELIVTEVPARRRGRRGGTPCRLSAGISLRREVGSRRRGAVGDESDPKTL
jgi:hypothetical protein